MGELWLRWFWILVMLMMVVVLVPVTIRYDIRIIDSQATMYNYHGGECEVIFTN